MEHDGKPGVGGTPDDAPLALLADFGHPASDRFLPQVRGGIERRLLVSHVVAGVWFGPLLIILQYVCLGLELFATKGDPPPRSRRR